MADDEQPAGYELDARVAEEVIGSQIFRASSPWWLVVLKGDIVSRVPAYSKDRAAAFQVEQRMFDDGYTCHTYGCKHTPDAPWAATFAKGPNTYHVSGTTVEVAICHAARKAKRAEATR